MMTTETTTTTTYEIAPATLHAMLDQVLIGCARDDSRPVLTGVKATIADGTLTLASADGFQLWVLSTPCQGADAIAILDASTLKGSLPALKAAIKAAGKYDADRATITLTLGEHASIDTGAARIALLQIQGAYPNYGALIPTLESYATDAGCHIALNGGYLSKIAGAAAKYGDSDILRMRTTTPKSPMRLDWKAESWTAIAVVMPMFVDWNTAPAPAPERASDWIANHPEIAHANSRAGVCESCIESAIEDNGATPDIARDACIDYGSDLSDHNCDAREDGTNCACTGHNY